MLSLYFLLFYIQRTNVESVKTVNYAIRRVFLIFYYSYGVTDKDKSIILIFGSQNKEKSKYKKFVIILFVLFLIKPTTMKFYNLRPCKET